MRRTSVFLLALASGALVCASAQAATAQAAGLHKRHHDAAPQAQTYGGGHEVTVTKRSFLDPGNVVPVGSEDRYVATAAHPAPAPGGTYRNDNFGDWLLPGNFGVPGFQR
ncbi:hypothetical protein [Rhodoblastus sp.]